MIAADQPTCFPPELRVAVSSRQDGTMLDRQKAFHDTPVLETRRRFCAAVGISYDDCAYQLIRYGAQESYDTCVEVTAQNTVHHQAEVHGDVLFTAEAGVGLFLPVADCVATIIYDPLKHYVALCHLGRHSTMSDAVTRALALFTDKGSQPESLLVWMSPSVKRDSYRLEWFENANDPRWVPFVDVHDNGYYVDLPGYNRERFIEAGVAPENIFISPVDTAKDVNYFSHAAGDVSGRIAVVAMMK